MTRFVRFFALFASMLWLAAGAAFADVFLVRDVAVDVTAENSVEARSKAFSEARTIAANRLVDRMTTAQDRARVGGLLINADIAKRLAAAVDVQDEKQSATRYVGLLSVKFDPRAVEAFFKVYDLPYVETQDALALAIPQAADGIDPYAWAELWFEDEDMTVLTPYVSTSSGYEGDVFWFTVEPEAVIANARRGMVFEAFSYGQQVYVRLSEVSPDYSGERQLNTVGPFNTLEEAKSGAIRYLESDWKNQAVVRATGESAVSAVAVFGTHNDWSQIERTLKASKLVKNFVVENMSIRGADLVFTYTGRPDQLASELRASGVYLSALDEGWQISTTSY